MITGQLSMLDFLTIMDPFKRARMILISISAPLSTAMELLIKVASLPIANFLDRESCFIMVESWLVFGKQMHTFQGLLRSRIVVTMEILQILFYKV